jgi:hypothetical protein
MSVSRDSSKEEAKELFYSYLQVSAPSIQTSLSPAKASSIHDSILVMLVKNLAYGVYKNIVE